MKSKKFKVIKKTPTLRPDYISKVSLNQIIKKNIILNSMIDSNKAHISHLEQEVVRIKTSRSWKIATYLSKLRTLLLPPNGKRIFFLKLVFNFFRQPVSIMKAVFSGEIKKIFSASTVSERVHLYKKTVHNFPKSYKPLTVPQASSPEVSIIIPVYNNFYYTYNCIKSIIGNNSECSFEIIVADDGSTDLTLDIERLVRGIKLLKNKNSLGFLLNCNNAAKSAKGKYILLLNNDTEVCTNWLSSLISTIESDNSIGLVGSKFVYPNGSLQEAGGIIWSDGSAMNYGRYDDPDKPDYNYLKEVDYISGASIMIRKKLWDDIGGFDERFAPAYCEDSDLAFEVRKKGYKVIYQPLSIVVHHEGISHGVNDNEGLKAYQKKNKLVFFEKWKKELSENHSSPGKNLIASRDRSLQKKHILVIDHYIPNFDKDAGGKNVYLYMKLMLNLGHSVTLLGADFEPNELYAQKFQQMGVNVIYGNVYKRYIEQWIAEVGKIFDFVYLNRPHIAEEYIYLIKQFTNAKVIFYGHDLHFLREKRHYELSGDKKHLLLSNEWREKEFKIYDLSDVIYVVGDFEHKYLQDLLPDKKIKNIPVFIYDNILDVNNYNWKDREGLLFVGGFQHPPNEDAVLWFAKNAFPQILSEFPDIKWYIVGSHPTDAVKALASKNVIVTGFVSDEELVSYYKKCRIASIPLRVGAGVKGKMIEAAYHQLPTITTSIGAEGISRAERSFVVEQLDDSYYKKIIELYTDFSALTELSLNSKELIKNHYTIEIAKRIIEEDFS